MVKGPTKYVFVSGGVLSGLGKGITAASLGTILKSRGLSVNIQKLDPYLNVDAGTLNPAEHGECFVTKDGAETDLDLGHYERFLDVELNSDSSVMSGKILSQLIKDEREGKYLGKTVQVVPHFTNAIEKYIEKASKGFDVHIVEIGGTVGDYESPAFFEAIRDFGAKVGEKNYINVQVAYLPYLGTSKEVKTKPAQNATRELRSLGILPDVLVARCEVEPSDNIKKKLAAFCGVPESGIVVLPNADTVYEVPITMDEQGIGDYVVSKLGLKHKRAHMKQWRSMVDTIKTKRSRTVRVGLVAKYLDNEDTYICVIEALKSAAWHSGVNLDYSWIDAEKCEAMSSTELRRTLNKVDGIVVPGGFGERALEGKIKAARFALRNKMPYLGLCLGLQMAVVAAARNSGLDEATTTELNPASSHQVVSTMSGQKGLENTGGTMRLGNYPCILDKNSISAKYYKSKKIVGRHRHRYECNNDYRDQYESWGIKATGLSPDGNLVEVIEGIKHPFFVASQFHPEFNSRPNRPQPLFKGFIESLLAKKQ